MDNSTDNKKKEYSYTYWVNKDPNQIKMDCQPKKVDDPTSIPQQPQSIHSQWNTSGTWEERKVTMDQLKKTLQQLIGISIGSTKLQSVESVDGDVVLFMIRGKLRMTYHLKIKYALEDGGFIEYTEFTDDGDREFQFTEVADIESIKMEDLHVQTKQCIESLKN